MPIPAPQLAPIPSAPPQSLPFYEPAPLNLGPARTPLNLGPARSPLNLGPPLPNLGQPLSLPGPAGVPRVPAAPIAPAPSPVPGGVARVGGGIGLAIGAASLGWAIGDGLRRAGVEQGLLDPEQSLYEWEKDDYYRRQNPSPIAPKQNVIPPGKAAPFTGGQCPKTYFLSITWESDVDSTGAGSRIRTSTGPVGGGRWTVTGPVVGVEAIQGDFGVWRWWIRQLGGSSFVPFIEQASAVRRPNLISLDLTPVDGIDNCGNRPPEPDPVYTPPRIQPLAPPILLPTAPGERPQNPRAPQRQPTLPPPARRPQAPPVPAERPAPTTPAPNPGAPPATRPAPAPQPRQTPGTQPQQQPQPPQPPEPPETDICSEPCIGDILDGLGTIRDLLEQPPEPDPLDCDVCAELEVIKNKIDVVDDKVDAIDDKVDVIDDKVDAIDDKVDAIDDKVDAIDDKVDVIDDKVDVIDDKVDLIRADLEVVTVSAPVVTCAQVTVNNSLVWAHTVEQREFRVFSNVAEGFIEQLKEVAILTEAECKSRNDKPPEYVAIMPSDVYSEFNIEGRLTLHFTKVEDWPKRTANSSRWSIEIPNPIDGLDWCQHFENFVYQKGSHFSRTYWTDSGIRSGAYCANKAAGEALLSRIESLSKATPLRRRFSEVNTPRRSLYQGSIRVYRATKTTIVDGVVVSCVTYARPSSGC